MNKRVFNEICNKYGITPEQGKDLLNKYSEGGTVGESGNPVIIPRDRKAKENIGNLKEGTQYKLEGDNELYIIRGLKSIPLSKDTGAPNTFTIVADSDAMNQIRRLPEGANYELVSVWDGSPLKKGTAGKDTEVALPTNSASVLPNDNTQAQMDDSPKNSNTQNNKADNVSSSDPYNNEDIINKSIEALGFQEEAESTFSGVNKSGYNDTGFRFNNPNGEVASPEEAANTQTNNQGSNQNTSQNNTQTNRKGKNVVDGYNLDNLEGLNDWDKRMTKRFGAATNADGKEQYVTKYKTLSNGTVVPDVEYMQNFMVRNVPEEVSKYMETQKATNAFDPKNPDGFKGFADGKWSSRAPTWDDNTGAITEDNTDGNTQNNTGDVQPFDKSSARYKNMLPLLVGRGRLAPDPMQGSNIENVRYNRVEAVTNSDIPYVQAASDNLNMTENLLSGRTDSQQKALFSSASANTQKGLNDAIFQNQVANNNELRRVDTANQNIDTSEKNANLRLRELGERLNLTALAKTQKNRRDYYESLRRQDIGDFNYVTKFNAINQLYPNYNFDPLSKLEFEKRGDTITKTV
jgi:hypothetical protein|tara:strand:+ start:7249 stop:8976 length:1728 start_codon:yes stop_codon:yes gene_type:complete